MIEVTLETLQMSLVSPHRIVVLRESNVERYLPIWIGPCEAESIANRLNGVEIPRPQTHDLIVSILDTLEADLLYVHINALADNTFFARLVVDVNGRQIDIDSRPSDAIAIAVRMGVPIYVAEEVMEEAGVFPERDLLPKEQEDLGVFRDFLSTLDIDGAPSNQES
ncbi:MAG TPA: bifunctional nuclease family protein [Anaerolineae bacterium]|nr:bifunctional nuclease family protein [Anaerolineae bacterium]HQH39968.1 bifunctional nuclease family protein [Anaerolineae bacterium]